jgi:hypothetical protein
MHRGSLTQMIFFLHAAQIPSEDSFPQNGHTGG